MHLNNKTTTLTNKNKKELFMIIRSPPNRQRNVSHHGKENCRCIGYVELINFLNSQGKKVVFVIDNPAIGFDPKTCLKRPLNFWKKCQHVL